MADDDILRPLWSLGVADVNGLADARQFSHEEAYELANGTLSFSVTADSADGVQGLFSKDATYFATGGHLTVWIYRGQIRARLQSEDASYNLYGGTVVAGQPTDVAVTFGDEGFKLYVDGDLVAENVYTGGLQGNYEPIVVGASEWASSEKSADTLSHPFRGELSDMALYGEALSAEQIQMVADGVPLPGAPENTAPEVVGALDTLQVAEGAVQRITLSDLFVDAEGDDLTFTLKGAPDFAYIGEMGRLVLRPLDGDDGTFNFTVFASDGQETSEGVSIEVTVRDTITAEAPQNAAPEITGTFGTLTVDEGGTGRVALPDLFSDPDGDTLTYTLEGAPDFAYVNHNNRLIAIPHDGDDGTYTFTIVASDGQASTALKARVVVEDTFKPAPVPEPEPEPVPEPKPAPNAAPEVVGTFDIQTMGEEAVRRISLTDLFSDPDGDALTYKLSGAPDFAYIGDMGRLVLRPLDGDDGTHKFSIYATDGVATSEMVPVKIIVENTVQVAFAPAPNAAPKITGTFDKLLVDEGGMGRVDLTTLFSDPDGDALTFTLNGAPDFVRLDEMGRLVATPVDGDDGSFGFTIVASDGMAKSAELQAKVVVQDTINVANEDDYIPEQVSLVAEVGLLNNITGTQHWGGGVLLSGYDLNGNVAQVAVTRQWQDVGFGVKGEGSRWDDQIDYYASGGGRSEKMVIDFNGGVQDLILRVGMLGDSEGPGGTPETGVWKAYDGDGALVKTGLIGPEFSKLGEGVKEKNSYGLYPIRIDAGVPIDRLELTATQFDYGEASSKTESYGENSSDYNVVGIDFLRVEPVDEFFF